MFPRARYQFQMKGYCESLELEESGITSQSDQPAGVLACPQQSFSIKLLTPKYDGSFILAILTIRSHQVNSRILLGPCFAVVMYVETWWPMLNFNLSYKPPSSWRILFWSGIHTRKFSCLKNFRVLVVPGGGCHKGIIIQGRQLKRRFSCGMPVRPDKKRGCNRSIYPCT